MNQRMWRFIGNFVIGMLLLSACQAQTQALVPITGSNHESSLPARVITARENVVEYVLASRLTGIPAYTDWQLHEIQNENEYHFRSGDWLMVIRSLEGEDQLVMIVNHVEGLSWTGYLDPDGQVVDTAYGR